jgi:hypothetical protein
MSGSARGGYSFRIQAEGFQEFIRDLQKVAGESDAAQRAIGTLIQSSPQLASSMTAAADATERAAKRATELREAQERAAQASTALVPATRTAGEALQGFEGRTQAARRAVNDFRGAIELVGLGGLSSALGPAAGLLGNVADAFGTAGLAAGRMEGALALLTPRLAAVAGLVALPALLQSVGLGINSAGEAAVTAAQASGQFQAALERLDPTLESIAANARDTAAELRATRSAMLALQAEGLLTARGNAIGQVSTVEEQIRRATRQAADADARAIASQANLNGIGDSPLLANRRRLAEADATARGIEAANARAELTNLENRRQQLMGEVDRLSEDLRRYETGQMRIGGMGIYGEPIGPQLPTAPRAPSGGGGRAAAPERSIIYEGGQPAGGTVFPVEVEGIITRNLEAQARAEDRAREQSARAEERALEQRQRANERVTDSIVQYGADRFADLFDANGRGWAGMLENFQRTARSVFARIAAEAILRPIISPIVDGFGLGGGLQGAAGGIAGALGGSGMLGSLGNLSSLSNLLPGGGISGMLSAPIFGAGALTSATNSALAGMGGAMGPATAAQVGLPGVSIGGALAGIGGGFAIGSTVGGFIAGDSRARQTNAQIGAGVGAVGGFLLGGPVGGLIGGTIGGAGGGLIGPGKGFEGGDALVGFDANGQLVVSRYQGKNFAEEAQLMAQARQQVAQLNAGLSATGLSFTGRTAEGGFATAIGGGQSPNPTDIGGALAASGFGAGSLTSSNSRVMTALGASGGASVTGAIEIANWVQSTYEVLAGIKVPAQGFAAALEQVNGTFNAAIARAKELQLATDGLVAAQQKQVAEIIATQNRQIGQVEGSITSRFFRAVGMNTEADLNDFDLGAAQQIADLRTSLEALGVTAETVNVQVGRLQQTQDLERRNIVSAATRVAVVDNSARDNSARGLLESLTIGGLGGLSPEARATAARRNIEAARRSLFSDGATAAEVAEFSRVTQAGLPVIQQSEGITTSFSALVASINDTLRQVAPGADVANLGGVIDATRAGATQVEAAIDRWGGRVETLAREVALLAEQVRVIAIQRT